MSVAFDPYVKWLGIRNSERPPNHYRLLGLDVFEDDPDVIATAADRQMGHVRKFQQGQHAEVSQRVLNELAAAKLCLLNPERKAAYDEQLRATRSHGMNSSIIPIDQPSTTAQTQPSRSYRGPRLIGIVSLILALAAVGSLVVVYRNSRSLVQRDGPPSPVTAVPPAADDAPENFATTEPSDENSATAPAAPSPPHDPVEPSPPLDVADSEPDADKSSAAPTAHPPPQSATATGGTVPASPSANPSRNPTLVAIREAMSGRDLKRARTELAKLHSQAETLDQRQRADRIELLLFQLERFWSAVRRGLEEKVSAGDQLEYKGATVTVKEVGPAKLSIEFPDGTVESLATDVGSMAPDLAIALVRRELPATSPTTDLVVGVFLALDRQGDVPRARELLVNTRTQGIPVDVLFPYWESRKLGEDSDTPSQPAEKEIRPDSSQTMPANRLPVPDADSQATALEQVRGRFDIDKNAESPLEREQQSRLAADLFHQAFNTHDSIAMRYVLFREALRLSLQSHNTELAMTAARRLEGEIDADAQQLLIEAYTIVTRGARTADARVRAGDAGVVLIDAALVVEDYEAALRLATLAHGVARKSRRAELVSLIDQRREQVLYLREQLKRIQTALEQLDADPASPEANYAVGRYHCLARGDFVKGLPYLSQGGDQRLAQLAKAERESSDAVDVRMDLADRWWEAAKEEDEFAQANLRAHAGEHYKEILPKLSLTARKKVEPRLAQLARAAEERNRRGVPIPDSLFTKLWKVVWSDKTIWQRVKFDRDGSYTYTVLSSNKEQPGRFQLDNGTLIMVSSSKSKFFYRLRPDEQQLELSKHDRQTGRPISEGVGKVTGTRQ